MINHNRTKKSESGIALLMTIMVLGVVLSVTLAMVELSLQHLSLSVDSKDSEIAFHAANAGLECARFMRRHASSSFETGMKNISYSCFGTTTPTFVRVPDATLGIATTSGAVGVVYRYKANIQADVNRCSVVDMATMIVSTSSPNPLVMKGTSGDLSDVFSGYGKTTKTCAAGAICTIVSVSGYNTACGPTLDDEGVLKRQVLLEF